MNLHDWYKRVDIASQQATRQRTPVQAPAAPQEAQATEIDMSPPAAGPGAKADSPVARASKNAAKTSEGRSRKLALRRVEGQTDASAMNAETREQLLSRLLDPILSLEEAAKVLNVCPTTVRRYTNSGALAHLRTQGNQRRFLLSDVLAFLKSQQAGLPGSHSSEAPAVARRRRAYSGKPTGSVAELERGS